MSDFESTNLFEQQEANRRRTVWLVIAFILFFAWLGFGGDFILFELTRDSPPNAYHHPVPWFGIALTSFAALIALFSWKTGPKRVLWSAGAREVKTPNGEMETRLVNVVEEMAIASGI